MKSKEEQMSEALDIIYELAVAVDESDRVAVDKAFSDIIALARYKFNVLPQSRKDST